MSRHRETTKHLERIRALNLPSWGFTIYRTVYTCASDSQWPTFLAILDAYIRNEINMELHLNRQNPSAEPLDPIPNQQLVSLYHSDIVSDSELLDGASISKVRQLYQERLRALHNEFEGPIPQRSVCIFVDAEVLDATTGALTLPETSVTVAQMEALYVKVVDVNFEADDDEPVHPRMAQPPYSGWMKVSIMCLWRLWTMLEYQDMEDFATLALNGDVMETFTG